MSGTLPFLFNPETKHTITGTTGAREIYWERFWEVFRDYQGDGAGSVARSLCCFLIEINCDVFLELHRQNEEGREVIDEPAVKKAFEIAPQFVQSVGALPLIIEERDERLVLAYNPHNHPRCSCYDVNPGKVLYYPSPSIRREVIEFLVDVQKEHERHSDTIAVNVLTNLLLWAVEEVDANIFDNGSRASPDRPFLSSVRSSLPSMKKELLETIGLR